MEYIVNDEAIGKICNPNYDFRLDEDIYQRFRFPFEAVKAGARIVIYGGGVVGKIFLQQIHRSAYCSIRAICDKAPDTTGIVEVPVIDMAELEGIPSSEYDAVVIAIEKKEIAKEIRENLIFSGISSDKIIYINPSVNGYPKQVAQQTVHVPQIFKTIEDCHVNHLGVTADSRFEFPFKNVPQNARTILYGGGVVGKTYLVQALSRRYIRLIAVCDRHPEKTGIHSVPILNISLLAHLRDDMYDILLVAMENKKTANAVINDLLDLGIPQEKIHWYSPLKDKQE